MKKKYRKQIDFIFDTMDWDAVAQMYFATNWRWLGTLNIAVPTIDKIKANARRYLEEVSSDKKLGWSTGSGGIEALNCKGVLRLYIGHSADGVDA